MTEQPRTVTRERLVGVAVVVGVGVMSEVERGFRGFLSLL